MRWQREAERGGVGKDVQQEVQSGSLRTESQCWGEEGGGRRGMLVGGRGPGVPGQKMSGQPTQLPCSFASQ